MNEKPSPHSKISVLVTDKVVYLRPEGYATREHCLGIPQFLRIMFKEGCNKVAIDLQKCKGMDSTFLGVIADAATSLSVEDKKTVVLLNIADSHRRELATVGVLPLVKICKEPIEPPPGVEFREVDFIDFIRSEDGELEQIKYLHEELMKLSERNRCLFGPFVEMLEEELSSQ